MHLPGRLHTRQAKRQNALSETPSQHFAQQVDRLRPATVRPLLPRLVAEPLDERGGYFIHTLCPGCAAGVSERNTRSVYGIALVDIAVVCEHIGVSGPEINRCAEGCNVVQQLAPVPLASAALLVQPIVGVGAEQKASQPLRSIGTLVRPWSFHDPQPLVYL